MLNAKKFRRKKLLRWAGSKSQSERHITPYLDFEKAYIEPFCGSASFFFSRSPQLAKLNDNNPNLINFYLRLQTRAKALWRIYDALETDKDTYYGVRREFNSLKPSVKKAAYFLYLNHYCFNGIYRTNQSGEFNTPYGQHSESKKKLNFEDLKEFVDTVKAAQFFSKDFEDFLVSEKPVDSCIYMDPPYFTNDARVFGEYGASTFQVSDLSRLRSLVDRLSIENTIVLTYKDCTEFRDMFGELIIGRVGVTRNVGGFSGRRKRESELIAMASPK